MNGTKKVNLFLNSASSYSIVDQDKKSWTIEEARQAWEAGLVDDYNMAFFRLANMNFDVDALKAFFARANAARSKA